MHVILFILLHIAACEGGHDIHTLRFSSRVESIHREFKDMCCSNRQTSQHVLTLQ